MRPQLGAFLVSRLFRPLLAVALSAALVSGAAQARNDRAPEPALWQVTKGASKVYLLGSIHLLPPSWDWRTKPIDAAIHSSDRFFFETSLTAKSVGKIARFVQAHGRLPKSRPLSRMLSPEGLKTFQKLLAATPLDPESLDSMRPWLALTLLTDYQVQNRPQRGFPEEGVDYTLELQLLESGKPVRYLETPEVQLKVLMQMTPDGDIAGFERDLRELLSAGDTYDRLLDSWTVGNQAEMEKILVQQTPGNPKEKSLMIDGRNRAWLPQIENMLASKETTFVTVGVAHLVGSGSIVDMMCARGWKVERVKTGPTPPPHACRGAAPPKLSPPPELRTRQVSAIRTTSTQ
jgi:uncharacterized protein YbaP (TraB family)